MKAKTHIRAGLAIAGLSLNVKEGAIATLGGAGAAVAVAVGVAVGNAISVNPVIVVKVL
jgi:hypothetical protein